MLRTERHGVSSPHSFGDQGSGTTSMSPSNRYSSTPKQTLVRLYPRWLPIASSARGWAGLGDDSYVTGGASVRHPVRGAKARLAIRKVNRQVGTIVSQPNLVVHDGGEQICNSEGIVAPGCGLVAPPPEA